MNYAWTCPQCGGHTKRYRQGRRCVVCSTCQSPVISERDQSQDIEFQRKKALAYDYLRVGNWIEARELIKPYCSDHPTDPELYLMLLVAETKCFTDLMVNDNASRRAAAEYWDKLERLNAVNSSMVEYAEKRRNQIYHLRHDHKNYLGICYAISAVLSLIVQISLFTGNMDVFSTLGVLTAISWIVTICLQKRINRKKKEIPTVINGMSITNPFSI